MNLRVRSVTGCSRSAMIASCIVPLAMVLSTVGIHAVTDRECVAGSCNGRTTSSRSICTVICVCAK